MSESWSLSSARDHVIPLVIAATLFGFALGRVTAPVSTAKHLKSLAATQTAKPQHLQTPKVTTSSQDPASTKAEADAAESSDEDDGELQEFSGFQEECKLVLVVRTDLGMTKGKIAAQCSHATLACYKALVKQDAKTKSPFSMLKRWEYFGQAKVTVQVKSEEELEVLQAQAMSLGLCAKIIHDAGRTQIASGSATVLGVGPGPKSVIDQVTGGLKLL